MFIQKYPYLNISIKVRAILAISIVPRGALVDSTYTAESAPHSALSP
jgi:hypothetical protein